MPSARPTSTSSRPRPPPRRRTRTMSFSIRATENRSSSKLRKTVIALLVILTLFLIGTVVVLSTVSYYLALPSSAFLDEKEVKWRPRDVIRPLVPGQGTAYWTKPDWDGRVEGTQDWTRLLNVTARPGETIPRIIHQTWKNDLLPEKWRQSFAECREGMPDYEYMLWTDETALEFMQTHYPHHMHMYQSYKYPIMRADAIRYFVLHHFGGIYMDLDIGCRRRLDPLLQGDWDTILPVTKPVGVSNDLMFSAKGSPFMDHTVHALPAWDHDWFINYPTVMFSTGPMFLSAQYAIYSAAHPITENFPRAEVRILPKSLYGKNIAASLVPHSFFSHFYGSSWHADDANFVTFLGTWGKNLMWIGTVILVLGVARLVYSKLTRDSDEYTLSILPTHSGTSSPTGSPTPFSPPTLETFSSNQVPTDITGALRRAGNLFLAAPAILSGDRQRRRQGLLYFVPALFQPAPNPRRSRTSSDAIPLRRTRRDNKTFEEIPPPPYESAPDRSLCSSPEPMDKRSDEEEDDGYLRSDSSSSECDQAEWHWKERR